MDISTARILVTGGSKGIGLATCTGPRFLPGGFVGKKGSICLIERF
jgi:hypothetical protein